MEVVCLILGPTLTVQGMGISLNRKLTQYYNFTYYLQPLFPTFATHKKAYPT